MSNKGLAALLALVLGLVGCTGAQGAPSADAAVAAYIRAVEEKKPERISELVAPDRSGSGVGEAEMSRWRGFDRIRSEKRKDLTKTQLFTLRPEDLDDPTFELAVVRNNQGK